MFGHQISALVRTRLIHCSTVLAAVVAAAWAAPGYGQGSPGYLVGPTITPTSPHLNVQAEEHIAVAPNNTRNLLAAVIDGAIVRLGQNLPTIKLAFSSDNGATWQDG
jgi:hypothetical protein